MSSAFHIGDRQISRDSEPYCIAEVGINHNGSIELAKQMVVAAKAAGADAVKFQTFKAEEFCGDPRQMFTYRSQGQSVTEPMLDMFRRYEFTPAQWAEIKAHCQSVGITFFSTPQNRTDLDLLLTIGVPVIKVGSDDFSNLPLLRSYEKAGLPMILSCGMSDLADVHMALEACGWFDGTAVALLLCTSQYPTSPEDVNATKLVTLQHSFPGLTVGFSDHTQGALAATIAAALGARVFEKHFTLDQNLPGPDHWFSECPQGLQQWIRAIHDSVTILGAPYVRPTSRERDIRNSARRSIVALRDIAPGECLDLGNIGLRRPGFGLQPDMYAQVLGKKATRKIEKGHCIGLTDITSSIGDVL